VQKVQQMTIASIINKYIVHPDPLIPAEIAANHVAAAALALVKWWLDNRLPYPPERMGAIYAALIINPIRLAGA
jgi:hypothetical protein